MSNKQKFNKTWANQTALGKAFGISSVAVGKILISEGLKDKETKLATEFAVKSGYATSAPMKDGTPNFLWNVQKTKQLISKTTPQISKAKYFANEVKKSFLEAEKLSDMGEDKLARIIEETMFSDVPSHLLKEVKTILETDLKLELGYFENW